MIEFAPNPSGPAHLGTLHSYAVAWLESRRANVPLHVRFDANQPILPAGYAFSPDWANGFMSQLALLELWPEGFSYVTDTLSVGLPPEWARRQQVISPSSGMVREYLSFPEEVAPASLPAVDGRLYRAGQPIPMQEFPRGEKNELAFAEKANGTWLYICFVVNLIHGHLRGVKKIVRGLPLTFLRQYNEEPAGRWFRLNLPDVVYCPVVAGDDGALRKSTLREGDEGTISHAIHTYGVDHVRSRILASAEVSDPAVVIHWRNLLEGDPQ